MECGGKATAFVFLIYESGGWRRRTPHRFARKECSRHTLRNTASLRKENRLMATSRTVSKARKIQSRIDAKGSSKKKSSDKAVQAGARKHHENPLPKQHQVKPGIEAKLKPRPQF